jgi:hypothetical protein
MGNIEQKRRRIGVIGDKRDGANSDKDFALLQPI